MTTYLMLADDSPHTVAGIAVPQRSRALSDAMREVASPHPDVGINPELLTLQAREDAHRYARALDLAMVGAGPEAWRVFLAPLARMVGKAPADKDALAKAAAGFAWALTDIPAAFLTEERSRQATARFKWWPTPADMAEWMEPDLALLRSERALAKRVAASLPTKPVDRSEWKNMTKEERLDVAAALGGLAQDIRQREASMRDRLAPVKSSYLTPAQELASFQQAAREGSTASMMAASSLARAFGREDKA